jgi:hypothetical protein
VERRRRGGEEHVKCLGATSESVRQRHVRSAQGPMESGWRRGVLDGPNAPDDQG